MDDGNPERAGLPQIGVGLLDRGRHHDFIHVLAENTAVVGTRFHPDGIEKRDVRPVGVAVGAGDLSAESDERRRQRAHPDPADTDEMNLHSVKSAAGSGRSTGFSSGSTPISPRRALTLRHT